jgi:G3E family GTPase
VLSSPSCAAQFGEIDIDSELVALEQPLGAKESIMILNNGCLCCTVRDDLVDMLKQLVRLGGWHNLVPAERQ